VQLLIKATFSGSCECPLYTGLTVFQLWWSVLLVDETRLPGENHTPVASH